MIAKIPLQLLNILVLGASFFAFSGCSGDADKVEPENADLQQVVDMATAHNSQNSVDYAGTYKGITPCADCEDIEVELTINADDTYTISRKYLGKGDGQPIQETGKYAWTSDGSTIELQGITDAPSAFKIGEGIIWQLDKQGKRIEGKLADKYILTKQ